MASKKDAKTIQLDGEIYLNFRRAVEAEGWRFGLTKKAEELLKVYTQAMLAQHGMKWVVIPREDLHLRGDLGGKRRLSDERIDRSKRRANGE